MQETPTKPYLLRALYEWCVDNGYTPHLAVKVDSRSQVPSEYVRNGEITLNVSPTAVQYNPATPYGGGSTPNYADYYGVNMNPNEPVMGTSSSY